MNKKGFTLVELTISIILLSLIMVFMFNFLSIIKRDEDKVEDNTKLVILRNNLAKYLNEDIRNNGGLIDIKCCNNYDCTYTCTGKNSSIGLHMKNQKDGRAVIKKLTLEKNSAVDANTPYQIIMYEDITDTNNIKKEFRKKISEGYSFNPITFTMNNRVFYINIPITLHPEFDIEIAYKEI